MTKDYEKLFAAISGHFLTQQLPDNWGDFDEEYLEEWFVECALDVYEYWDWTKVFDQVKEITETVMETVK
jgi:hypothetical protein